jgi:hypothetical protein
MKEMMLFLLLLLTVPVAAQSDWHEALREWLTAEDVEESYGEELLEQLEERAQTPINLNQTCREELEELPFLTAQQVEELTEYLDHYKPMRSLSELQMVKGLDYHTRRLLQCFVVAGEERKSSVWPKAADLLKYGQHRMTATGKIPFYERQGDRNGYLGYKYRHDLRYQYTFGNRIKAGITAAQDAGEPFFTNKNSMGYDQYNYYVQLRDFGRLEELNLGHYRVQMGMGLVMNTSFHLGKLTTLQTMGRGLHTLSAHSSRSASNHLQGIAATVRLAKQWRVMAFASYQAIDATLNDDGTARTLLYSGYHRTPTEIEKKHNTYETDLGASIGWHQGTLHINANAVYTRYDRSLQPMQNVLYHTYSAQGNSFLNMSLDYGWNNHRWAFSGETALNKKGAVALIHTVNCRVTDKLSLMLLHRYYDKRYTAQHANSFREGSSIQNEHGIYLGATWQPLRSWFVQGYVDYAHFSWPRYQVSASSDAFDALLAARYSRKRWTWNMRYRMHIRQHDNDTKKLIINQTSHRLRMAVDWSATPTLTLRTQGDGVVINEQGANSRGVMVGQQVRWQQQWLKMTGTLAWFHSDDYDSRLYQYEPSMQYDFSFPAYYGHGIRYIFMAQADIGKHLALATKLGVTNYFDRSIIGTGLQQIDQSSMADLLVQLNVKL